MKKWVVEPYLKLRNRRQGLTSELLVQVQNMETETQKISQDIQLRVNAAMQRAELTRQNAREKAEVEQAKFVAEARASAEKKLGSLRKDLSSELDGEFKKLSATAKELAAEVVARVRRAS